MYNSFCVGRNIRQVRKMRGLTIVELSENTSFSASHITQVELGTRNLSIDMLVTISNVLETDPNTLLRDNDEPDFVQEISQILKTMTKEEGRKMINILLSVKGNEDGGV